MIKILLSDYYATGEGRTICLLITMYERADITFEELFPYYTDYVVEYTVEKLLESYSDLIPKELKQILLEGNCYVHYYQEFHYNYG
jgi:hypothetical protein